MLSLSMEDAGLSVLGWSDGVAFLLDSLFRLKVTKMIDIIEQCFQQPAPLRSRKQHGPGEPDVMTAGMLMMEVFTESSIEVLM